MAEAGASWASGRVSPGAGRQTEVGSVSVADAGELVRASPSLPFLLFLLYTDILFSFRSVDGSQSERERERSFAPGVCGARSWEGCSAGCWGAGERARESGGTGGAAAPAQNRRRFPGSLGAAPPPPGKTEPPRGLQGVAGNSADERKLPTTSSPRGWRRRPVEPLALQSWLVNYQGR